MPAQRQTNMHSLTAHLVEVRDTDGTLYPSVSVDPGESIDWPQPIAGFDGWDWESQRAVLAAEAGLAQTGPDETEGAEAAPSVAGKSRTKAPAKAADTPEATA